NTWNVWGLDGEKKVYGGTAHLYVDGSATFRWLLASRTDRHGNTVSYDWACDTQPGINGQPATADCYPSQVHYGNLTINVYREVRKDTIEFAHGQPCGGCNTLQDMLGKTTERLKSVVVRVDDGTGLKVLRAYQLNYANITPAEP